MNILLVDVDSKWFNLALMKLSTFHKKKGDKVRLLKLPKLDLTFPFLHEIINADLVYVSCIFSENRKKTLNLMPFNRNIVFGGSGIDLKNKIPEEIEHAMPDYSLYNLNFSVGFTSRGCIRKCPWCIVWKKEGYIRDHAPISEFWDPMHTEIMLLDGNFLASPRWRENLEFIRNHRLKVNFNQGLDIRVLSEEQAELLSEVHSYLSNFRDKGAFFAWDDVRDEDKVMRGIEKISQYWPPEYLHFYVLGGYPNGDEFDDLYYRCKVLTDMGIRPYVMPYNNRVSKKIRDLKRCISSGTWRKKGLDYAWKNYDPTLYRQMIKNYINNQTTSY